jgi:hypothetical protein
LYWRVLRKSREILSVANSILSWRVLSIANSVLWYLGLD